MSEKQYTGKVRHIDPSGTYGFIRCRELGDVYFRMNKGERITYDPERNEIVGYKDQRPSRNPQSEDEIVFVFEELTPRKAHAVCWGLVSEYEAALKSMQNAA